MRPELAVTRLSAKSGSEPVPPAWQPFGPAYEDDDDSAQSGPPFETPAQQNGAMPAAALSSMECRTLQVQRPAPARPRSIKSYWCCYCVLCGNGC
jgi:hypothetical protein